jgi:hypothetical protein
VIEFAVRGYGHGCLHLSMPIVSYRTTARPKLHARPCGGLVPCATPIESPPSNGISKDFIKQTPLRAGQCASRRVSISRRLERWLENYNTVHPRGAIGRRSVPKAAAKKTTEDAVDAVRRPHPRPMSADTRGSRPSATHGAVAQRRP